ncbi:5'(3')-deoxyribonucleotidase [uncultured Caudovirales phage]|uniref:5'(3')-deoxyribonucleotidase n=1 Tax=uncultured Caudovirales phage TaxID=2100421 RepID=A0A6J5LPE1_9CAUD|nr:5'(3')-deoxyribonucleotidase [uncultured Caudovirales phage]
MKTLYLDMDGVVADFDEYAARTLGIPPSSGIYPNEIWYQLATNQRLYRDLIKTPYADELVFLCSAFAKVNGYDLKFLSAVPKGNDVPWAFFDKVQWAQKYFPSIPVFFGPFSKDKHVHCKVGDILIDDRASNIDEWKAAGGIAIHHKNIDATLQELSKLY